MNAQEILSIIESKMDVSEFAYNDYPIPDDFKIDAALEQITQHNYDLAREKYHSHPGYTYTNKHLRDEKYEILKKEFENTPHLGTIIVEEYLKSLGLGKVVEVEKYGGEDMGSTWYSVKHFVDHDIYIKTEGYYSSYNGTDFNEGYGTEVRPIEKKVIVFE